MCFLDVRLNHRECCGMRGWGKILTLNVIILIIREIKKRFQDLNLGIIIYYILETIEGLN